MKILISNDDGYQAKGIRTLAEIMSKYGELCVIAPKVQQSGMSMAVSLGGKKIGHKDLGGGWHYLDATPASCVKFGLNTTFAESKPDVVVSGINHGSNAATAACYSGTLGAAAEGALNGIPAIGVSIFSHDPDADFSAVEKYFPAIFEKLMADYPTEFGIYYNINFPDLPADKIKGVRIANQGLCRWVREFRSWEDGLSLDVGVAAYSCSGEEDGLVANGGYPGESVCSEERDGEEYYVMIGEIEDDDRNLLTADHHLMLEGYITVVPHRIDCTDYQELNRLRNSDFETEF